MSPEDSSSLHRRIQELLLGFSRGISSTLSVATALDALSSEANVLFGTRRVSVWLHERRARELVLAATSDPGYVAIGTRLPTVSESVPARGLRLDTPQFLTDPAGTYRTLVGPLRGWRRALGTLVIDGEPRDLAEDEYIEAVGDLGRHLSFALENVQLLEEVLQQRRQLEDTFNSLADLVVVTDTALRVVQTNDAFLSRVGRPRADIIDRPLAELVGADIARWVAEPPSERPTDGRGGRSQQFTDDRLGGIFSATVTALINRDGQPVGRVLVARDITAHMQLEAEREALRGRLQQSEKLASLGQFVAGIAHEMNNPLQGVLGHLELLIETSDAAKPVRPTLKRIYLEADRAAKIVRNLLVFAGSQRMTRQKLRVERLLARALASRAASLRRSRVEVVRHVGPNVPPISGDALLLQQALLNILINAEHAIATIGDGGRIETSIVVSRKGDRVKLAIQDSGPGILPEILPRIFDPFFTTKEVGKGTGLGLAITYGIVQEHGGTIQVENAPRGGARFTIELPALQG